jgi:hypothetical protein
MAKAAAQHERHERRKDPADYQPDGSGNRVFDLLDAASDVKQVSFEDRHALFQIADLPVNRFHFCPRDFAPGNAPKPRLLPGSLLGPNGCLHKTGLLAVGLWWY